MKFFINNHSFETINHFTITELLFFFNLKDYPIAVELNGVFFDKKNWSGYFIQNFDEIEIVTIVGGG